LVNDYATFRPDEYWLSFPLRRAEQKDSLKQLITSFCADRGLQAQAFRDFHRLVQKEKTLDGPDVLMVQFGEESLDSVSSFAQTFYKQFRSTGIQLEMEAIETANNFNAFNRVARFLAGVLSLFAIVLLVFTITRAIFEHIDRNAKSLGTLKAFGLANTNIGLIYTAIAGIITLGITLASYLFTVLLGPLAVGVFFSELLYILNAEDSAVLFQAPTLGTILTVFCLFPLIIIYLSLTFKLKGTTPGDLIYNRNN